MFERLEILIGKENVMKLQTKHVLLIGVGGVGGYAFEALVRSNIGTITIIDYDTIDITNLNRQIITYKDNIGNLKVFEAEDRAYSINPKVKIITKDTMLSEDSIEEVLTDKYDFIIDACDMVSTKIALIKFALKNKIKIITCMGTANKLHPELLKISTLNKTSYDPLAKKLRKEFKDKKIPVVFSEEKTIKNTKPLGSSAFVPGTAGLLCASYVINKLLND